MNNRDKAKQIEREQFLEQLEEFFLFYDPNKQCKHLDIKAFSTSVFEPPVGLYCKMIEDGCACKASKLTFKHIGKNCMGSKSSTCQFYELTGTNRAECSPSELSQPAVEVVEKEQVKTAEAESYRTTLMRIANYCKEQDLKNNITAITVLSIIKGEDLC